MCECGVTPWPVLCMCEAFCPGSFACQQACQDTIESSKNAVPSHLMVRQGSRFNASQGYAASVLQGTHHMF